MRAKVQTGPRHTKKGMPRRCQSVQRERKPARIPGPWEQVDTARRILRHDARITPAFIREIFRDSQIKIKKRNRPGQGAQRPPGNSTLGHIHWEMTVICPLRKPGRHAAPLRRTASPVLPRRMPSAWAKPVWLPAPRMLKGSGQSTAPSDGSCRSPGAHVAGAGNHDIE